LKPNIFILPGLTLSNTPRLKGTDWGNLDVLILDLPPGTGDVQLTLCQDIELSGAVGVTTPSKLAIADARKGIQMFSELGVPTLALVENMSFFECAEGKRHYPFGQGIQDFADTVGDINTENICQLPLSLAANDAAERGVPWTLSRPSNAVAELEAMTQLARIVSRELLRLPFRPESSTGVVTFDDAPEMFELSSMQLCLEGGDFLLRAFTEQGAVQRRIAPEDLRARDPRTGETLHGTGEASPALADTKVSRKVKIHRNDAFEGGRESPDRVEKKGKVGFEVTWGDGAKYIYSRRAIAMAAGGRVKRARKACDIDSHHTIF
jgi:NUBPL iron-transfer P-loop NTPase